MPKNPPSYRIPNYVQNPHTITVGEFLPDLPPFGNSGSTVIRNAVPLTPLSYGPLPSLSKYTTGHSPNPVAPLPHTPLGSYAFLDRNGNEHVFVGTPNSLYTFQTGLSQFKDVSGRTYNSTLYDPWAMVSYLNTVICTNGNDPPQARNIDIDDTFNDLNLAQAPFGRYTCVCRDFLVFANVVEPQDGQHYPQRLHWSSIGDPGSWPQLASLAAAETQSDAQDLRSDLGHIRGIGSNLQSADMVVLMDKGVYTVRYVGSPAIFDFQIAQGAVGCQVPGSVVINRGFCYYLGLDGFYAFDGTTPTGIGANKVDKFFFNDPVDGINQAFLYRTQSCADPTGRLIFWAYCSKSSTGTHDRLLIYNWQLQRFSVARLDIAWLGQGLTTGYTLDQLNPFGNLEAITPPLDDPYWQGGKPLLMGFDDNNQMMVLSGPNLEAVIETQEINLTPGSRSRITNTRPLVDGTTSSVAIGTRNRLEDDYSFGSAVSTNVYGQCPVISDARYHRGRVTIAAGAVWSHCEGLEVDYASTTER